MARYRQPRQERAPIPLTERQANPKGAGGLTGDPGRMVLPVPMGPRQGSAAGATAPRGSPGTTWRLGTGPGLLRGGVWRVEVVPVEAPKGPLGHISPLTFRCSTSGGSGGKGKGELNYGGRTPCSLAGECRAGAGLGDIAAVLPWPLRLSIIHVVGQIDNTRHKRYGG